MKRIAIAATALLILVLAVFFWALSRSGPDHAPQTVTVIDLDDNYEK